MTAPLVVASCSGLDGDLTRRMLRQAARELFLTGEPCDGARARQVGLLDRAVDENELDASVDGLVVQLIRGAPARWPPPRRSSAGSPVTT